MVKDALLHLKAIGIGPVLLTIFKVIELPVDHDIFTDSIVDADSVEFELEADNVIEMGTVKHFQDTRLRMVFVGEIKGPLSDVEGVTVLVVDELDGSLTVLVLELLVTSWLEEIGSTWAVTSILIVIMTT